MDNPAIFATFLVGFVVALALVWFGIIHVCFWVFGDYAPHALIVLGLAFLWLLGYALTAGVYG